MDAAQWFTLALAIAFGYWYYCAHSYSRMRNTMPNGIVQQQTSERTNKHDEHNTNTIQCTNFIFTLFPAVCSSSVHNFCCFIVHFPEITKSKNNTNSSSSNIYRRGRHESYNNDRSHSYIYIYMAIWKREINKHRANIHTADRLLWMNGMNYASAHHHSILLFEFRSKYTVSV